MSHTPSSVSLSPSGWNIILIDQPQFVEALLQETLTDFCWQDRPFSLTSINSNVLLKSESIAVEEFAIIWLNYDEVTQTHLDILDQIRYQQNNQATAIILTLTHTNCYPDESLVLRYNLHDLVNLDNLGKAKIIATLVSSLKTYQYSFDQKTDNHFSNSSQRITKIKEQIQYLLALDQQLQQEINQREIIEKALLKSQKKLASILELAQDAIISINQNQIITLFNQGASKIFGYEASEVLGQSLDILLPQAIRNIHHKHIENYQKSTFQAKYMSPFREITALRKDGTEFPAEASIFKIELETEMVLTVILRDISERKEAEKQLQLSYHNLEEKVQKRTESLQKTNQALKQEINDRIRIEEALKNIATGVQSKDYQAFFESMARYIARALNIEYILIGELIKPDQIASLAFCVKGELADAIAYSIINTPCQKVIQEKKWLYQNNLQHKLSQPQWLQNCKIDSYMGIPLLDSNHQVLGVICVFSPYSFSNPNFIKEVLQIFAARAGAELERLRTENSLLENEEKFKQLAENLNQVFYIYTASCEAKVIYLSPAFEKIWGIPCEAVYQNTLIWLEKIHPEDQENIRKLWNESIEKGHFEAEYRIARSDGEIRWIYDRSFPIYNGLGQLYRLAGIAEDITERKAAEEALQSLNQNLEELVFVQTRQLQEVVEKLRLEIEQHEQTESALCQSEERWQLAIHGTNDGIWDWNPQTNEVFYSERWKEMLGYEDEEIGNSLDEWSSRVHPDDLERVMKKVNAHLNGETSYYQSEHRVRCKNGHYKWILDRGKALRDETGKLIRVVGSHSDIHQRKEIEEAVRQNEQKLRKITALVPGMVFQFGVRPDNQYFMSFASDGAYELYELTPETIIDDVGRIFELISSEQVPLFMKAIEYSRENLTEFRFDYQITTPSGCKKWINANSLPQRLEDGTVIWYGVATDVTIQKQQEKELIEAKQTADAANRAKSEFLANMSHEIRTPMNAILGFCQLLQDYVNESRPRSYLNAIISSGNTLLALINDILDLSKIEAGKLELNYEPINVRSLLQEISQIFSDKAAQKSLNLVLDLDHNLPSAILFDETRFRQIMFNLIGNAIKFTERGQITLSLLCQPTDTSEVVQVIFKVADTGIGIKLDQLERIFESFTQQEGQSNRKYGGTGLGLAITKRLVEMLGGTITITSQEGIGSTFIVTFPKVSLAHSPEKESFLPKISVNEDLNQFSSLKILVADDTQSNLDLIEGYFVRSHHQLIFARDGQQTIAFTHQYQPDLILLDLRMPNLDGNAVAQYLKRTKTTQNIPIVILTASALQQEEELIRPFCEGFLRKPVSCQQLIAVLQDIFPFTPVETVNITPSFVPSSFPSPELLEELDSLVEEWQEVSKTKITKDIRQFYQKLMDLAQQYSSQSLLDYGNTLKIQLEDFDLDSLDRTLEQFPHLIEQNR